MIVSIDNPGELGMIFDLPAANLPVSAWTEGVNVRFLGTVVQQGPGNEHIANGLVPHLVYGIFPVSTLTGHYWVLCGLTQVTAFNAITMAPLGPALKTGLTGTAFDRWTGGVLNGVLVITNGVDIPQMWNLPAGASALADLTAWPSTMRAKVIRPFKNFLVALDITKGPDRDIRLVMWSTPASPGNVPSSWDTANPALDAGEVSLAEGQDGLIDCLPLGDSNVVYTATQTWAMRLSGTNAIFTFRLLFPESGLLGPDCVAAFRPGRGSPPQHFCVTDDDFIIHDGSAITSVGTDRVRQFFFTQLTSESRMAVRVANKHSDSEIWVFWAQGGGTLANKILAWNYQYDTWSLYDIPPAATAAVAVDFKSPVIAISDTWDGDAGTWDSDTSTWNSSSAPLGGGLSIAEHLIIAEHPSRWLTEVSTRFTTFVGGAVIPATLRRMTVPIKGAGQDGKPVLDHSRKAMITRFWPKIIGEPTLPFIFLFGVTQDRDEIPVFGSPSYFTIGQNRPVDLVITPFRYLSIWMLHNDTQGWKMSGSDWDIFPLGRF